MLVWFEDARSYKAEVEFLRPLQLAAERAIEQRDRVEGYCVPCGAVQVFRVDGGPRYGEQINLREGLICPRGLSNRQRLLAAAALRLVGAREDMPVALFERLGPLFPALKEHFPRVQASEYLGPSAKPGQEQDVRGTRVRNESLENLSYPSESFGLVMHSDVLEHVPDFSRALKECHRVLRSGGTLLFTCPFFAERPDVHRLAARKEDGTIEYFGPPEYHGDPLNPEGVLTYHHFGWGLLDELRHAGFRRAAVGVWYDVFCGFVSNNHPGLDYGNMLPLILVAER